MKKIIILLFVFSVKQTIFSQGVKIGGTGDPDATAILELDGGSGKGLLLPRMTTNSMNALNAANGMIVYNSTDASLYLRKSGSWQKIAEGNAAGGGFTLPLVSSYNLPGNVLDLTNTSLDILSGAIKGFSENGTAIIGNSNSGNGGYFSSTTGPALITGTGKVGIGTSTPTYPLTLIASGTGFVHRGAGVEIGTTVSAIGGMLQTFTNHPLRFATGGSNLTKMILTTNGELGVGTSLPVAKMHASWDNSTLLQLDNTKPLAQWETVKQHFKIGSYYTGAIVTTGQSASTAKMSFHTGAGLSTASLFERMTILNNGNVGINKISPEARLQVAGKTILEPGFGDDAAVEIRGLIKVTGDHPAAFAIISPPTQFNSGVPIPLPNLTIDNPACNGKPNAMLFVTVNAEVGQTVSVRYDILSAKWKIYPDQFQLGFILPSTRFNVLVIDK